MLHDAQCVIPHSTTVLFNGSLMAVIRVLVQSLFIIVISYIFPLHDTQTITVSFLHNSSIISISPSYITTTFITPLFIHNHRIFYFIFTNISFCFISTSALFSQSELSPSPTFVPPFAPPNSLTFNSLSFCRPVDTLWSMFTGHSRLKWISKLFQIQISSTRIRIQDTCSLLLLNPVTTHLDYRNVLHKSAKYRPLHGTICNTSSLSKIQSDAPLKYVLTINDQWHSS